MCTWPGRLWSGPGHRPFIPRSSCGNLSRRWSSARIFFGRRPSERAERARGQLRRAGSTFDPSRSQCRRLFRPDRRRPDRGPPQRSAHAGPPTAYRNATRSWSFAWACLADARGGRGPGRGGVGHRWPTAGGRAALARRLAPAGRPGVLELARPLTGRVDELVVLTADGRTCRAWCWPRSRSSTGGGGAPQRNGDPAVGHRLQAMPPGLAVDDLLDHELSPPARAAVTVVPSAAGGRYSGLAPAAESGRPGLPRTPAWRGGNRLGRCSPEPPV